MLVTRSHKKKPGDFEISFEENFVAEHLKAFRENIKNLVENSLNNFDSSQESELYSIGFGLEPEFLPLDIIHNILIAPSQRQQFLKDLEYEEKLRQFLETLAA